MSESDPVVKQLQCLAKKHKNIAVLWLYGSRAKGSADVDSDYDLAVAFERFPSDAWQQRLQAENLAYEWAKGMSLESEKISVIDINHVPIQLAMAVIEQGQAIQVNDSLRMAKEENRISGMWEIDHLHHRQKYG
jgi:predicted nucleotidyltransferase